jgi:hypothetical protein
MQSRITPNSATLLMAKLGLAMGLGVSPFYLQAAPNLPGPQADSTASLVTAANDGARRPHPHREVQRGPVKPTHYPSNPLPPPPTRQ